MSPAYSSSDDDDDMSIDENPNVKPINTSAEKTKIKNIGSRAQSIENENPFDNPWEFKLQRQTQFNDIVPRGSI